MSQQSPQKVLDRILNYPHKEKGCAYICGPHLEPCVMVRAHDGDCECRECAKPALDRLRQARDAMKMHYRTHKSGKPMEDK